jgi:Holin of 3TMs, for gene-transfer release
MGLNLGGLLGLGQAVGTVAEVFVDNRTKQSQLAHEGRVATLGQLEAEFARSRGNWFDQFVDGLNRMPRPILAFSAIGLFAYAMLDPLGFGARMQGLALVPDPLWWLLGAIVSFYFGARELHYLRGAKSEIAPETVARVVRNVETLEGSGEDRAVPAATNPALSEWQSISDGHD